MLKLNYFMTNIPLVNFIRLLFEKKNNNIWIYSESIAYWPFYNNIVKKLLNSKIEIIYISSDKNEIKNINKDTKLKTYFIGNGFFRIIFFVFLNCKNIIMTMPDLDNFYIKRSKNNVNYIYLFHSLNSSHLAYKESAFDNYNTILAPTKYIRNEILEREKLNNLNQKKIYNVGYSRLDNLLKLSEDTKYLDNYIVIAPTRHNNNLIRNGGNKLISLLLKNNYKVELRAHHENKNKKDYRKLIKQFENHPNFFIKNSYSNELNILKPEYLITDWSGVALEFSFATLRPTLFVNTPMKMENSNYRNLNISPFEIIVRDKLGISIKSSEINKVTEIILFLKKSRKMYGSQIKKIRDENIFNLFKSDEKSIDIIKKMIND